MSYSFHIVGADKLIAKTRVAEELDKVAEAQPAHDLDKAAAYNAAYELIELLPEDDSKLVQVGVSGWIAWQGEDTKQVTGINVSVSVSLTEPPAKAA